MGGNAFKTLGYDAQRMDLSTFRQVETEIQAFLHSLNIEYLDIPSVHNKNNFGDLDILVVEQQQNVFEKIQRHFIKLPNAEKIIQNKLFIQNGDCLSVLYQEKYQIDFIRTYDEYKNYHQKYLSYNDLGNLIGRCVKEAHYKHGHDGLFYQYYDGTRIKKNILISQDYHEVLQLLKLDIPQFDAGFNSVTAMFAYVASSPYFKPSVYHFENLNHANRLRDKKRKNYHLFLDYVAQLHVDERQIPPLPTYQQRYAFIEDEIQQLKQRALQDQQLKAKFNGQRIQELTQLNGKILGDFIKTFKFLYSDEELASRNQAEIDDLVLQHWRKISSSPEF